MKAMLREVNMVTVFEMSMPKLCSDSGKWHSDSGEQVLRTLMWKWRTGKSLGSVTDWERMGLEMTLVVEGTV